jgi:FMN-dependent NADH-azoreductase
MRNRPSVVKVRFWLTLKAHQLEEQSMNQAIFETALRNYRAQVETDSGRRMTQQDLKEESLVPEFAKAAQQALDEWRLKH